MERFVKDVKKYFDYAKYAAKSELKAEVSSSYLNWLWWVLDPLLFMCVYSFVVLMVFQRSMPYFPVFVFIGLSIWNFFSKCVQGSVKLVRRNGPVVRKVYLPKYLLIMQEMMVYGFKMMVSFLLVLVLMGIYRIPLTWNVLYIIPIIIELLILTFGLSCIMLHFGVFVDDLNNIMVVVLKAMFYMSGVIYSIEDRLDGALRVILLECNPIAMLMNSARQCLIYSTTPSRKLLLLWGVISVLLCMLGVRTIYKYENSYVKVM